MRIILFLALLVGAICYGAPQTVTSFTPNTLKSRAALDDLTFELNEEQKTYHLGLVRPKGVRATPPSNYFLEADVKVPGKFHIGRDLGVQLTGIFDQGACGSCVYNSVLKNAADLLLLKGVATPVLSRQYTMDCLAREWRCDGSYFEKVAAGVVGSAGVAQESDYRYRAVNQACQGKPAKVFGKWTKYQIINNTPKSIMTALFQRHPVSVTVAADGYWSGYKTGVYNACSSMSTNHQVLIYGWDCQTSVDAAGNCVFGADGYPINGDGFAIVPNSWGTSWGESGEMRSVWRKNGKLCNNLAEEAGILESGATPPPTPVDGGWSAWGPWSACINGLQSRSRTCTNPPPSSGGKPCAGPATEFQTCKKPCSGFLCGFACWLPWCSK